MRYQRWILVHPAGDETKISLVLAFDYEYKDYKRCSRKDWDYDDRQSALEYGRELAIAHSLEKTDNLKCPEDFYLD